MILLDNLILLREQISLNIRWPFLVSFLTCFSLIFSKAKPRNKHSCIAINPWHRYSTVMASHKMANLVSSETLIDVNVVSKDCNSQQHGCVNTRACWFLWDRSIICVGFEIVIILKLCKAYRPVNSGTACSQRVQTPVSETLDRCSLKKSAALSKNKFRIKHYHGSRYGIVLASQNTTWY